MSSTQRRVLIAALTIGVALTAALAVRPASPSCRAENVEPTGHRYAERVGSDPDLTSLDVYRSPTTRDCPVIIWVHGGSWQEGSRSTRSTTVKADHYVGNGWIFISVDCRLAAVDNDVRWPDFGTDVAAAVAWTVDHADDIGADPAQITLMGHSSGAHLVSIIGTNEALLADQGAALQDVRCVVSLNSVTHDLTDPPPWEVDIIELAFPDQAAKVDGSPTLQARSGRPDIGPSFSIVTRGRPERLASSERLAAAIQDGGGLATVADVSPYDHGEVSTQLGVADESVVTPVVDRHLDGCAATPG